MPDLEHHPDVLPPTVSDVEFDPPLEYLEAHYSEQHLQTFFESPTWLRENGRVRCVRGVLARELFRVTNEGVLQARREYAEDA